MAETITTDFDVRTPSHSSLHDRRATKIPNCSLAHYDSLRRQNTTQPIYWDVVIPEYDADTVARMILKMYDDGTPVGVFVYSALDTFGKSRLAAKVLKRAAEDDPRQAFVFLEQYSERPWAAAVLETAIASPGFIGDPTEIMDNPTPKLFALVARAYSNVAPGYMWWNRCSSSTPRLRCGRRP